MLTLSADVQPQVPTGLRVTIDNAIPMGGQVQEDLDVGIGETQAPAGCCRTITSSSHTLGAALLNAVLICFGCAHRAFDRNPHGKRTAISDRADFRELRHIESDCRVCSAGVFGRLFKNDLDSGCE